MGEKLQEAKKEGRASVASFLSLSLSTTAESEEQSQKRYCVLPRALCRRGYSHSTATGTASITHLSWRAEAMFDEAEDAEAEGVKRLQEEKERKEIL